MNRTKSIYLALLAVLLSPMVANADIITYTSEFALNSSADDSANRGDLYDHTNTYANAQLDRFDATLGTLTDIQVSFSSEYDHRTEAYARDNRGSYDHWYWGSHYYNDAYIYTTARNWLNVWMYDPNLGGSPVADDYNYGADCSRSYSHYSSSYSTLTCRDTSNDLNNAFDGVIFGGFNAAFIGTDAMDFRLRNYTMISGNCDEDYGDYCSASTRSYWAGDISVQYTYTAASVPEPATLALLGLGLAGMGMTRRKKKV